MNEITKTVRLNIFDALRLEKIYFGGALDDIDFLSRLYDLKSMPSYDSRFSTADGDIWQHRLNNFDWQDDWVFGDARFNLTNCPDAEFLNFICEMVHPVVRPDFAEASAIVSHLNEQLQRSGWRLVEEQKIAGRAIYSPEKTSEFHSQISRATSVAQVLSSNWMQTEIRRIQGSIDSDPALAIGTSKDLIESCCKTILQQIPDADQPEKNDDLPTLSKKLCKALELVPEGISNEARGAETIKRTLSNLAAITKGVAELRSLYGSGHGRDGQYVGLEPRHARLAASCAIAFVDFATETFVKRHKGAKG